MGERVHGGGCLCGAVRYEVRGEPESSSICHCLSCRKASGAQAVAWLTFGRDRFSLLAGEPVAYRSSERVVRTHCGACGTSLTYAHDEDEGYLDVTTASLDTPEAFPPTHHTWVEYTVGWDDADGGLPRFQKEGPPGQGPG